MNDIFRDRTVLVTGGTKGIGLATALVFARHGAQAVLTYGWGSADEAEVVDAFESTGCKTPLLIQADVSRSEDTLALFEALKDKVARVDAFISNASVALVVAGMEDYSERGFLKSLRASAWPTADYLLAAKKVLGAYPRHVVVMSSDGPDRYTPGYDFVAASKAASESIARYLAYRLKDEGVRINVLRSRAIKTDSFDGTFGSEFFDFLSSFVEDDWFMTKEEVANAAFALCSGLFDGMSGQVLMADRGSTFADGISYIYERRMELDL